MNGRAQLLPPRYEDARRIASGGMAEVWRATDTTLGRPVAIKLLDPVHAQDEELRGRFLREARAAARLSGESTIVDVYDVGEWDGRPYIVMQYLGGGSLEDYLRRRGIPPPSLALEWIEQAAAALDRAHDAGVVHRDVKPGNLLLDERDAVHVADFGIASASGLGSLTLAGTVLGTAGYLAPEQARGEQTTPASDRYALAVVAYELLTGHRPNTPGAPLPFDLAPVFRRALAERPAERYPSASELAAALQDAFTRAAPPTRRVLPVVPPSRRLALPLAVALALVVIAGFAVAALLTNGSGTPRHAAATPPTTTSAPATSAPAPTTSPTTAAATTAPTTAAPPPNGDQLNLQGYQLMQQGQWAQALPVLQQAVSALQGTGPGDVNEGYANYNLGVTLLALGRCAEAVPYLQRAQALEPGRHEVDKALKTAEHCLKKQQDNQD